LDGKLPGGLRVLDELDLLQPRRRDPTRGSWAPEDLALQAQEGLRGPARWEPDQNVIAAKLRPGGGRSVEQDRPSRCYNPVPLGGSQGCQGRLATVIEQQHLVFGKERKRPLARDRLILFVQEPHHTGGLEGNRKFRRIQRVRTVRSPKECCTPTSFEEQFVAISLEFLGKHVQGGPGQEPWGRL
jgi:hypothetical protein